MASWNGIVGFTTANLASNRHPEGGTTEGSGGLSQNPTRSFSREMRDQDDGYLWAGMTPIFSGAVVNRQLVILGQIQHLKLYNLQGQQVLSINQPENRIDLNHLQAGIYIAEVKEAESISRVKVLLQ